MLTNYQVIYFLIVRTEVPGDLDSVHLTTPLAPPG